jgi:Leucine-rich repeat (LRR) protein
MSANRSAHQEKIIKNYYKNRDSIGIQKAQEAITELYLSQGKKRETIWKRLCSHLEKAGLSEKQIQQLREKDDPAMVAEAIQKLV